MGTGQVQKPENTQSDVSGYNVIDYDKMLNYTYSGIFQNTWFSLRENKH